MEEIEPLIGFFLNLLALRLDLMGKRRTCRSIARSRFMWSWRHRVIRTCLSNGWLRNFDPERALGQTPLFQVIFTLLNRPARLAALAGLSLRSVETEVTSAKYDLSLLMLAGDRDLIAQLKYSTDLFDATTMERLLQHLEALLAAAVAGPDRPFGGALASDLRRTAAARLRGLRQRSGHSRSEHPSRAARGGAEQAYARCRGGGAAATTSLTYGELWRRGSRHWPGVCVATGVKTAETRLRACALSGGLDMVPRSYGEFSRRAAPTCLSIPNIHRTTVWRG